MRMDKVHEIMYERGYICQHATRDVMRLEAENERLRKWQQEAREVLRQSHCWSRKKPMAAEHWMGRRDALLNKGEE